VILGRFLNAATGYVAGKGGAKDENKALALFDGKRSQNVSIAFSSIRRTPEELAEICISMNPATLTRELTEVLLPLGMSLRCKATDHKKSLLLFRACL
jgi:hypothetical protein